MTANEFNAAQFRKDTQILFKGKIHSLLAVDFQWGEFKLQHNNEEPLENIRYTFCLIIDNTKP